MEIVSKRMYLTIILTGFMVLKDTSVLAQTSAVITQVRRVSNVASSAKIIECAFQLMKNFNKPYARIAEGAGICELLYRPSFSNLDFFEDGYDYFEKSTIFEDLLQNEFKEKVEHKIFSAVKLGDKFTFEIEKTGVDRMVVDFKENANTSILIFTDTSKKLSLNDKINKKTGQAEYPPYPFSNFTIYNITFEVLDLNWEIYVNDKLITTFTIRQDITMIKRILVKVGHQVNYISKAIYPRM